MKFLAAFLTPFLSLLFIPVNVQDQSNVNAGLVSGLWFSEESFFAGDDIRVYAAFQNQSDFDLEGVLSLEVDGEEVGSSDFTVLSERLIELWIDWEVPQGDQKISLKIKKLFKSTPDGLEEIEVDEDDSVLATEKFFVDVDTDGDGIGNLDDIDDDGDRLLDEKEIELGTDPLNRDTDGDGVIDGSDTEPLVPADEVLDEGLHVDQSEEPSTIKNIADKTKDTAVSTNNLVKSFSDNALEKIEKAQESQEKKNPEDRTLINKIFGLMLFTLGVVFSSSILPYLLFLIVSYVVIKILIRQISKRRNRSEEQ